MRVSFFMDIAIFIGVHIDPMLFPGRYSNGDWEQPHQFCECLQ